MVRALLWVLVLTAVYGLTVASFGPCDVALGAIVAVVLVATLGRVALVAPGGQASRSRRLVGLPLLVGAILRDMTAGTWQVSATVLGLRPLRHAGIVVVPFGERSDAAVLATAFAATLSPGEFLVEIDWDRRVMVFHVLDAGDPDRVRARFADFYRRHQHPVVP